MPASTRAERPAGRRGRRRSSLILLGCLALTVYFAHHAVNGRHGLATRNRLLERSAVLEREASRLEAARAALRRDVALLATEPPHPDMVEEIAGAVLGFARPGGIVLAPGSRPDPR